jgi:hypothetical protein
LQPPGLLAFRNLLLSYGKNEAKKQQARSRFGPVHYGDGGCSTRLGSGQQVIDFLRIFKI